MRRAALVLLVSCLSLFAAEDWKGPAPKHRVDASVMTGILTPNQLAGIYAAAQVAIRVVERGFSPEINNQVFIEMALGLGSVGNPVIPYSIHMRWDFHKDEQVSLFAIGGFSGYIPASSGPVALSPFGSRRFGIGGRWTFTPALALRGELDTERFAVGLQVNL